jgi:hypothetical protein
MRSFYVVLKKATPKVFSATICHIAFWVRAVIVFLTSW